MGAVGVTFEVLMQDRMLVVAATTGTLSPTVQRSLAELREVGADTVPVDVRSRVEKLSVRGESDAIHAARLSAAALDLAAGDPTVRLGFLADGDLVRSAALAGARTARTKALFALFPDHGQAAATDVPTLVVDDDPSAGDLTSVWGAAASLVLAPSRDGAVDVLGIQDPVAALVADFAARELADQRPAKGLLPWLRAQGWDGTYPLEAGQRRALIGVLRRELLRQVASQTPPTRSQKRRVAQVATLLASMTAANVGALGVGTAAAASTTFSFSGGVLDIDLGTAGAASAVIDTSGGNVTVNSLVVTNGGAPVPAYAVTSIDVDASGTRDNDVDIDLDVFDDGLNADIDLGDGNDIVVLRDDTDEVLFRVAADAGELGVQNLRREQEVVLNGVENLAVVADGVTSVESGAVALEPTGLTSAGLDLLAFEMPNGRLVVVETGSLPTGLFNVDGLVVSASVADQTTVDLADADFTRTAGELDIHLGSDDPDQALGSSSAGFLFVDGDLVEDGAWRGNVRDLEVDGSTAPTLARTFTLSADLYDLTEIDISLANGDDVVRIDSLGDLSRRRVVTGRTAFDHTPDHEGVGGHIYLHDGNDQLYIGDVSKYATVLFDVGDGNDLVEIDRIGVDGLRGIPVVPVPRGSLEARGAFSHTGDGGPFDTGPFGAGGVHIDLDSGTDTVRIGSLFGAVQIEAEESDTADDLIEIGTATDAKYGFGFVALGLGAGDDLVQLDQIVPILYANLGDGDDRLYNDVVLTLYDGPIGPTRAAFDHATLTDSQVLAPIKYAVILGGEGEDDIRLGQVFRAAIDLGGNDDALLINQGVAVSEEECYTPTGASIPTTCYTTFDELGDIEIRGGTGDDAIEIGINEAAGEITLLGGSGEDSLRLHDNRTDSEAFEHGMFIYAVSFTAQYSLSKYAGPTGSTFEGVGIYDRGMRLLLGSVSDLTVTLGGFDDLLGIYATGLADNGLDRINADGGNHVDGDQIRVFPGGAGTGSVNAAGVAVTHQNFEIGLGSSGASRPPTQTIYPSATESQDAKGNTQQEFEERELDPGQTYSTDRNRDGRTSRNDPIHTEVTLPGGGTVQVSELGFLADRIDDEIGDNDSNLGTQDQLEFGDLQIDLSIDHEGDEPAQVVVRLHPSLFSEGADLDTLRVFLNGAEVPDCTDASAPTPDPCLASVEIDPATGELVVDMRTTSASVLSFAVEPTNVGAEFCEDVESSTTFEDVPSSSPHRLAIECLATLDVIEGTSDTTFDPATSLSRGQTASLVVRLADLLGLELPSGEASDFSDVPDASPHATAIDRLSQAGILAGFTDGAFRPGARVTRGQFAAIMMRLYDLASGGDGVEFDDQFDDDDGTTHELALNGAAALGLLSGFDDVTVGPGLETSRAQAATILANLAGRLQLLADA